MSCSRPPVDDPLPKGLKASTKKHRLAKRKHNTLKGVRLRRGRQKGSFVGQVWRHFFQGWKKHLDMDMGKGRSKA